MGCLSQQTEKMILRQLEKEPNKEYCKGVRKEANVYIIFNCISLTSAQLTVVMIRMEIDSMIITLIVTIIKKFEMIILEMIIFITTNNCKHFSN